MIYDISRGSHVKGNHIMTQLEIFHRCSFTQTTHKYQVSEVIPLRITIIIKAEGLH